MFEKLFPLRQFVYLAFSHKFDYFISQAYKTIFSTKCWFSKRTLCKRSSDDTKAVGIAISDLGKILVSTTSLFHVEIPMVSNKHDLSLFSQNIGSLYIRHFFFHKFDYSLNFCTIFFLKINTNKIIKLMKKGRIYSPAREIIV